MSMLNLPGELLKSGVNNVVSGGKRLVGVGNSSGQQLKDKTTLTVKATPNKDAISVASIASKTGYLMKRNEQGQFHRRFVCTVPHMFLYYFDNEMADTPRGIIDLDLFTKIEIEPDNETVKLSTQEDVGLRPYYLQLKDPDLLSEWVASLLRDRYNIIKEERDAYRQLQDHFTGEMEVSNRQAKNSSQDMERLYKDVMDARSETEEAVRHIAKALSIIGISEEEMRRLSTTAEHGDALASFLRDFIQSSDQKLTDEKEEHQKEIAEYEERLSKLDQQIDSEQEARKSLELKCLHDRKEADAKIRETVNQMDQTSLNMQMAVAAKVDAENKCTRLSDQKKVLVKEVKQSRKKIEELTDSITALKATIVAQQTQLAMLQVGGNSGRDSFRTETPTLTSVSPKLGDSGLDSDDEEDGTSGAMPTMSPDSHADGGVDSSPSGASWEQGEDDSEGSRLQQTQGVGRSSYLSNMFGSATHIKNNAQPLLGDDFAFRQSTDGTEERPSLGGGSEEGGSAGVDVTSATAGSGSTSQAGGNASADAFKLRCLRCKGTVEGPKYSTCKCAVPALSPDDLDRGGESSEGNSDSAVGNIFKATGSLMTNIGRRASIMSGGHSSSNVGESGSSTPVATPTTHSKRASITGMFGFGNND